MKTEFQKKTDENSDSRDEMTEQVITKSTQEGEDGGSDVLASSSQVEKPVQRKNEAMPNSGRLRIFKRELLREAWLTATILIIIVGIKLMEASAIHDWWTPAKNTPGPGQNLTTNQLKTSDLDAKSLDCLEVAQICMENAENKHAFLLVSNRVCQVKNEALKRAIIHEAISRSAFAPIRDDLKRLEVWNYEEGTDF